MAGKPKPRHWKPNEIKPLPKRLHKSIYGEEYNDSWKLRISELSEDEKEALEPILKARKFKAIYRIPEVDYPAGNPTPDILIDGVKLEIKTPARLKEETISGIMRQANKQTKGGALLLNVPKITESITQIQLQEVVEKAAVRRGGRGVVVSGGSLLFGYRRKEGLETAIQHKVSNPKPSYIEIISKKEEIVKVIDNDPIIRNVKPKLRTQTRTYWQKRSVERTLESERQMLPYIRKTRQVYAKSAREITKQVQDIYDKYYRDNGFDTQALRELAPQGDVRRLKARMRKAELETELPDNYAFRVNRLEMLNMQTRIEAYEAGQKIKQLTGKSLAKTYENGYYRTIYDTAKGIGHTPAFSRLNKETISKVLDAKNYGKNFSERIWGRSQKLSDELQSIIGTAIATGQSPAKTARLLRERFNVSASSAERLIRTETNYFENQAEIDAYKEMGVEEYQFVATIDTRTSEICQHLDHKTFKVKDAKVGVNVPPLHPNCRSTVTPYFGKEWEPEIRIARNPQTGRNEYVTNMSYKEWFGKITDGTINISEPEKNITGLAVKTSIAVQSATPISTNKKVHKRYIGDRNHLLPLIQDLWAEKDPMAQGFAKVLSGIKKKVTVGNVTKKSRQTLLSLSKSKAKTNSMRIRLSRSYLLHMDNSGHFTGFGYGKYGHDDKNPLSVTEIKNIARIINSANKNNTLFKEVKRGVPRLSIVGKTDNNQMVLVEIDKNGNFADVVTSYKLTKRQWLKMQIEIKRQNTAL